MILTAQLLQRAVGCTAALAERFAADLNEAADAYGISATPERLAAFLAQLGHESNSFRHVRELWGPTPQQRRYEGRADLGNTQPGDGRKFSGHGLIQVTGRRNHAAARDRLRARLGLQVPDFEQDPEALEHPRWACWASADFWDRERLNVLADAGKFIQIGRAINRGNPDSSLPANGEDDRLVRWAKAKAALADVSQTAPSLDTSPERAQKTPEPIQEATMPPLIAALGQSLISIFTPLAAEKIQREISRHTDRPEVAEQVTTALIDAAKVATGQADPIAAVAAVRQDPAALAQVEQSALDKLASMAPLLQQLEAMDRRAFSDEEGSRTAAAERAAAEPRDMAGLLAYAGLAMVGVLIVFVGVVAAVHIAKAGKADTEVWAALTGLIGWATAKVGSIYDYRFGSSRSSGAKDAVIGALSQGRAGR